MRYSLLLLMLTSFMWVSIQSITLHGPISQKNTLAAQVAQSAFTVFVNPSMIIPLRTAKSNAYGK